jgi:hypothetical protein
VVYEGNHKPCDFKAFLTLINGIINFILFYIAIPISALMFAFAGFEMVTSGGSEEKMVKGYPIEEMLPEIFAKDRVTAAFLIGIAKKESNWGKRHPVLDGQDCFNYWGYRGQRRLMGSGGHTCFNSRKDAVDTVATRIDKLVNSERLNTPAKLIVWKCGFSCEGHSRESVQKWIADVDAYYSEMMAIEGSGRGTEEEVSPEE